MSPSGALELFDEGLASDPAALDALRRIIDFAVSGTRSESLVEGLTSQTCERFIITHRLGPLLEESFAESAVPAAVVGQIRMNARRLLTFDALFAPVRKLLNDDGAEFRVLKGMATAHLDYSQPHHRHFGDVDILLQKEDLPRVEESLLDLSFRRHDDAPGIDPYRMQKAVTYVSSQNLELDVHLRLLKQSSQSYASLFSRPDTTSLGDQCLSPEGRLVHAAAHATLTPRGFRRLSSLVDCSVILRRTGVDLDEVGRLARQWRVDRLVSTALQAEAALAGSDVIPHEIQFRRPHKMDPIALAYLGPRRRLSLEYAVELRQVPVTSWIGLTRGRLSGRRIVLARRVNQLLRR